MKIFGKKKKKIKLFNIGGVEKNIGARDKPTSKQWISL